MATRALVFLADKKKGKGGKHTLRGIYSHWDGYPLYLGKILQKYYWLYDRAQKLIENGAASFIAPLISPNEFFDLLGLNENEVEYEHNVDDSALPFVSRFYHRDRGEDWKINKPAVIENFFNSKRIVSSMTELLKKTKEDDSLSMGQEYIYIGIPTEVELETFYGWEILDKDRKDLWPVENLPEKITIVEWYYSPVFPPGADDAAFVGTLMDLVPWYEIARYKKQVQKELVQEVLRSSSFRDIPYDITSRARKLKEELGL